MRILLAAAFAVTLMCAAHSGLADDHVLLTPDDLKWKPLPREWFVTLPPSVEPKGEVAIIHGDPDKAGAPFIIRLRSPDNSLLPVHWHEFDEHITVLAGVWCVGTGDRIDPNACTNMPAGSYIFLPKHMHHWAVTKGSVVQVSGMGPFRAYLVR